MQKSGENVPLAIVTNLPPILEQAIISLDAPIVQDERFCPDLTIWKP